MLSFIQLSIVYAFTYSAVLIFLIQKCKKLEKRKEIIFSSKVYFIDFISSIVIFYLPIGFYSFIQTNSYPGPDTYGYVISSYLDLWEMMPINDFYKIFPIYVLLNKFIGIVTGLDYSLSIIFLHCSSLLLIFLGSILLIRILDKGKTKIPLLINYALILISSIYLYSYFNFFIPQIFALFIIIFLFYSLYQNMIPLFILFSILSLVHISTIPLFQIYLIFELLIDYVFSFINFRKFSLDKILKNVIAIFILFIIHFGYTFYAAKGQSSFLQYIKYYFQIIIDIFYRPDRLGVEMVTSYTGISRRYPFLSALATGAFLSLIIIGIVNLLFRKEKYNSTIVALMILGAMLTVIGVSKYYVGTYVPSFSVARYVNVPGFFLLSIFAAYTLYLILSKYRCKIIYYFLLFMLCSGMVGSFFDPLTFPFKPFTKDVILIQTISNLFEQYLYSSICFLSESDWYYLGPQLAFWTFRTQRLLPHFRYVIGAPINKEHLYVYANIIFSAGMRNIYLAIGKEALVFS